MDDEPNRNRVEELLTVIAKAVLAPVMQTEFQDKKLAALYALTGKVTADEACKRVGLSKTTVIEAWARWVDLGLIIKEGKKVRKSL